LLAGTGDRVSEGATPGRVSGQLVRRMSKRRWVRPVAEVGYDATAWAVGLLTAARATSDLAAAYMTTAALGFRRPGSVRWPPAGALSRGFTAAGT
jgi:hypothetical protein